MSHYLIIPFNPQYLPKLVPLILQRGGCQRGGCPRSPKLFSIHVAEEVPETKQMKEEQHPGFPGEILKVASYFWIFFTFIVLWIYVTRIRFYMGRVGGKAKAYFWVQGRVGVQKWQFWGVSTLWMAPMVILERLWLPDLEVFSPIVNSTPSTTHTPFTSLLLLSLANSRVSHI